KARLRQRSPSQEGRAHRTRRADPRRNQSHCRRTAGRAPCRHPCRRSRHRRQGAQDDCRQTGGGRNLSAVTDLRTKEAPSIAEPKAEKAFSAPLPFWQRRRFRMSAVGVIALLFRAVPAAWLGHPWTHVYIDDSRSAANLITVSSEVNGRVLEVPVVIGDAVKKGDLLVRIDRSQTKLERDAIEAQIAAIEAEKQQLRAQQDMIRVQI